LVFTCEDNQSVVNPDENKTHCPLWHELCYLHGFSPGEKQV
jgi:hypothetical protein